MRHFRTIHFYGAGPEWRGASAEASHGPFEPGWPDLRDAMSRAFDLDLCGGTLEVFESYWPRDGWDDGDGAELVSYEGKLIGAINRKLTDAEFTLISSLQGLGNVNAPVLAQAAE